MIELLLAAALAAVPAASRACPLPQAVAPSDRTEFERKFAPSSQNFRRTKANIAEGFRRGCRMGVRVRSGFSESRPTDWGAILLENWPDATVFDLQATQQRDGTWRLMLGGPFVSTGGRVNVPTVAEVQEAVFCAVKGATRKEQRESGRCLSD